MSCIDQHAPVISRRIGKRNSPWINSDLKTSMRQRDALKMKAILTDSELDWNNYKRARNTVNNSIRLAKRELFYPKL